MYTYKVGISAKEHDDFVLSNRKCNLLQSSKWAIVKSEWDNELLGFYHDDQLVATASVLIRKLPLGFTMIYIPRGPIMHFTDFELTDFVVRSLKEYGRKKRAVFIKFDPSIFLYKYKVDADKDAIEEDELTLSIISFLQKHGIVWGGRTKDLSENIQPRLQANIHAQDFGLENLPKKTKQAIRTAQNKGIEIQIGGMEMLDEFSALMKKTEARKGIHLRGKDYYQKMMSTFEGQSYITMAKIDLNKRKTILLDQETKAKKEQAKFNDNTKPTKVKEVANSLERIAGELDFLNQKIDQGITVVPLAATLTLIFGKTSENLYAGMDEEYRQYQAALYTWFETANEAFKRGCIWQNMGGIENQLEGGLYNFKSKLNPTIEEFAGEFNIPVNPLYKPAMLAYKKRKQLRSKH